MTLSETTVQPRDTAGTRDAIGISFGAGVQSTALLLMAIEGRVPADFAIFADTQDEPAEVYVHLWEMARRCSNVGMPLYVVTAGRLSDEIRKPRTFISIPAFGRNLDGKAAQLRRQCSYQFKLRPMRAYVKHHVLAKRQGWWCLVGISKDESHRAKPSGRKWVTNSFPLLDLDMSRYDAERYCNDRGVYPPRSACTFCPYRSNAEWRDLTPTEFEEACVIDDLLRVSGGHGGRYGDQLFLHRTMTPLREVDIRSAEDRGQGVLDFSGDCMGLCGV